MKEFYGTGVALVTPFDSDNNVDLEALERLVEYQIENGIDYLVVLGTTAETATLSKEEKKLVKEKVKEFNRGRLPLVVGLGGNNTHELVKSLKTDDFSGYSAILSVSPYYNKPSQEGIYQHFKCLAENSSLPIILYNVPPRTGSNMSAETVLRLAAEFDNIIGVKEASGSVEQALDLLKGKPNDFLIISGEDKLALGMVLAGGAGVISVIGQGLPKNFSTMIREGLNGNNSRAYEIYYGLSESIDHIFAEGNPSGIKSMLHSLGIIDPNLRLPLVAASEELQQKINTFVSQYKD